MSTMLKTAAMSLLSKTLQTFLYKYLLEVDVEGVAMPSFMDTDGHSGWGVRLCNVKLREGVELLSLPGKRKIRRKRKKQQSPHVTTQNTAAEETENSAANDDESPDRAASEHVDERLPRNHHQPLAQNTNTIDDKEDFSGYDSDMMKLQNDNNHNNDSRPPRRGRMLTEEDTEVNSALSSRAPSPRVFCRTSAIAGCLASKSHDDDADDSDDENQEESNGPTIANKVDENVIFDTKSFDMNGSRLEEQSPQVETIDIDDEEEEDDFIVVEEDMMLRLGNGGRIGTLDIRLVGKELHVMVEDAFLTVEACPPKEEEAEDDDASAKTTSTTSSDGKKKAAESKKKKKPPPPAQKKKAGETSGEQLMQNNPIARALSALPHLFLRDVRVRLIVRGSSDEESVKPSDEQAATSDEPAPHDSVVELGIEMLSVTSGDDFLEHFQQEGESAGEDEETATPSQSFTSTASSQRVSLKVLEEQDENEYLEKRIRTGKGPEGGISVKIFPPQIKRPRVLPQRHHSWAFDSFAARAQYCLFRCSGIDVRTRMFLGKKKEVAIKNNDYAWYGDEYDEYTIDSMLFGVDYIAPAPPPLPPLKRRQESIVEAKEALPMVERFSMDANGIQSNQIRSCFHKAARGLMPSLCQKDHLPSDNCPYCWKDSARPNSYSENPMDSKTPLPGLVLNISLNEPLELSVERSSLQVIGEIQGLFSTPHDESAKKEEAPKVDESKPTQSSITERLKNMSKNFRQKKEKKESLKLAFPSYMKPETIQVMGLYVAKVVVRVHMMRNEHAYDEGLAFRYWEASLKCITVDMQSHKSKEKSFHDIKCDLAFFQTIDYFGVEQQTIASVGLPGVDHDDSMDTSSSPRRTSSKKGKDHGCWPTTAAVLLQIPPSSGVAELASRERHALQLRFFSIGGADVFVDRTTLDGRVGTLNVFLPSSLPNDVDALIQESYTSIFGPAVPKVMPSQLPATKSAAPPKSSQKSPSLLQYAVRLDGGKAQYSPLVQVKLPVLRVGGELSSDKGVFLETLINHVKVEYGDRTRLGGDSEAQLSLSRVAQLPETVRLRIIFFLNDLGPLEKALGIKRESSSFLRCRAVNKAIFKAGKRSSLKASKKRSSKRNSSRVVSETRKPDRQAIIDELTKLDDTALQAIWSTHKGHPPTKPRLVKKRSASNVHSSK